MALHRSEDRGYVVDMEGSSSEQSRNEMLDEHVVGSVVELAEIERLGFDGRLAPALALLGDYTDDHDLAN